MAKLTEEMKEFFKGKLAYVATVSPEGIPNVGPKASIRIFDDEHIGWNESTGKKTFENLQKNPNVAFVLADAPSRLGYRFTGKAELLRDGPIYEATKEQYAQQGRKPPHAVVRIKVDEVYDVGATGRGSKVS